MKSTPASSHLYHLIEKMTPTERRYFKIFSKNHTIGIQNHYVLLFDIIVQHLKSSSIICEKEVRREFQNIYNKKRFDLYKSNLYKKILESLESYHKHHFIEVQLNSHLNQAHILNRKGLPDQALKIIKKAKDVSSLHEKWYVHLDLLQLERNITYAIQNPLLENERELDVIHLVTTEGQLRHVQSQLWKTFLLHGLPTDIESQTRYSEFLNHEVFDKNFQNESTVSKITRLYCLQFIAGMETKIQEAYDYGKSLIDLMDAHPKYMEDKGELYLRCLINWQYAMVRLNKFDEVMETLLLCRKKLREIKLTPSFVHSMLLSLFVNEYEIHFKLHLRENLTSILSRMNQYAAEIQDHLGTPAKLIHHWQNANHYFYSRDYNTLLDWTNKIHCLRTPYRKDIQAMACIFELIAHYKLGNQQLLTSFTVNTYRQLKRKERLLPIEDFLMRFIKQDLPSMRFSDMRNNNLTKVRQKLLALKKSNVSHEALLLMYFEDWLHEELSHQITKT